MKDYSADFELLVAAAVAGERCPMGTPFGPLSSGAITALATAGKIRSEVFQGNYRVVTILEGPHAGKSTKTRPGDMKPYRVTDRSTRSHRKEELQPRQQPSAPRPLMRSDIDK